jgi:hypothetical protein
MRGKLVVVGTRIERSVGASEAASAASRRRAIRPVRVRKEAEVAVKEATAARQTAHEAREDKEGRAQAAGKGVGALRDAADEADALAQRAMEAAELSVQEDVQVGRRSLGYRLLLLSSCCCVRCCCCVAGSTDLST